MTAAFSLSESCCQRARSLHSDPLLRQCCWPRLTRSPRAEGPTAPEHGLSRTARHRLTPVDTPDSVDAMVIPLLLACQTTPSAAPGTVRPPSADAPVLPAAPEPSVVRETITLNPDEVTYDESAGTLVFSPGARVRAAHYTHYILDLDSVESVLGARPVAPVVVVVELTEVEDGVYLPEEIQAAAPDGGFRVTNKTGRILSAVE